MSAFQPQSFEEAKLTHKPMSRKIALGRIGDIRGREVSGKPALRSGIKRNQGSSKKIKRAKMPSFRSLVKKADRLVSEFVRARDKQCVECGAAERLQCGHVFGRRSLGARFDITPDGNCHGQCAGCNFKAAHTAAVSYHAWYVRTFGAEKFEELYRRWAAGRKWTRKELMELIATLRQAIKEQAQ